MAPVTASTPAGAAAAAAHEATRLTDRLGWPILSLALGLPALAISLRPGVALSVLGWAPALAWEEPWRWWSAAWVHLSPRHLMANLAGLLLVALLGLAVRAGWRAAAAWALAWPLTHGLLLMQPELARYGGLSGVLHAGVAVAALQLWRQAGPGEAGRGARRLALALGAGLGVKLLMEAPWAGAVQAVAGWDIPVAPGAHLAGVAAGVLAGAWLLRRG
jgi:rhomboid family GlyGly-CTERM serine protease